MPELAPGEGSLSTIPNVGAFAPVYERMLELAGEYLDEPVTGTVKAYEDGTFRITFYHYYAGQEKREVLYYHTERSNGEVRYAVEDQANEAIKNEQVVTSIEPGMGSK